MTEEPPLREGQMVAQSFATDLRQTLDDLGLTGRVQIE